MSDGAVHHCCLCARKSNMGSYTMQMNAAVQCVEYIYISATVKQHVAASTSTPSMGMPPVVTGIWVALASLHPWW